MTSTRRVSVQCPPVCACGLAQTRLRTDWRRIEERIRRQSVYKNPNIKLQLKTKAAAGFERGGVSLIQWAGEESSAGW